MEAGLEGPRGLCYTAAAIWYIPAIDVLRNVASPRRRTSNVINSFVTRRFRLSTVSRSAHLSPESWEF